MSVQMGDDVLVEYLRSNMPVHERMAAAAASSSPASQGSLRRGVVPSAPWSPSSPASTPSRGVS
jgi:hypothetical protein